MPISSPRPTCGRRRGTFLDRVRLLTLAVLCVIGAGEALSGSMRAISADRRVQLVERLGRIEAWPAVSLLFDASGTLSIEDARGSLDRFETPRSPYATLGVRTDPVWLHIPLEVDAGSDGHWILDVDHPPLELVDVYLLSEGRVIQQVALGGNRPFETRPLRSRAHSVPLELQPGAQYDVVIRVKSTGTLILPISFKTPTEFHAGALREQMLQGVLGGLGLCLLLYSLTQWVVLREPFFLKYSVLISGSLLFSLLHFGIGMQFLWTNRVGIERHVGAMAALIALMGSFLFVEQALNEVRPARTFSRIMKGGALFCSVVAVLYAFDLGVDTPTVTKLVSVLGLSPVLIGAPRAIQCVRRGDPIGGALLVAWFVSFVTTAVIIGVIRGKLDANFWTMHAFQFGATFDMIVFTYVLGLRTRAISQVAQRARVERDRMHELAMTDPLTGLANRRGLSAQLSAAGDRSQSADLLALYWVDVDGFKAVNDRHGHDVGDALLVQIGKRLRAAVRGTDLVARLGGDEFVIVADSLQTPQRADAVGRTLAAVVDEPFALEAHTVRVGLTIGYAIAPLDTADLSRLLLLADGAMYEGKGAGKSCLRRTRSSETAPSTAINGAASSLATALDGGS